MGKNTAWQQRFDRFRKPSFTDGLSWCRQWLMYAALCAACSLTVVGDASSSAARIGDRTSEKVSAEELRIKEAAAKIVSDYLETATRYAPGLAQTLLPRDMLSGLGHKCESGHKPQSYAIVIGVNDIGMKNARLVGPENDASLFEYYFEISGKNIHKIVGENANREYLAEIFSNVIDSAQCGDRVFLTISSHGVSALTLLGAVSRDSGRDLFEDVDSVKGNLDNLDGGEAAIYGILSGDREDLALLLHDDSEKFHELILGRDLSDFALAVRNRGAHAILLLDTDHAGSASIIERQKQAAESSAWSYEYLSRNESDQLDDQVELAPGHGEFIALYATGAAETTPELPMPRGDPDAKKYGLFSYTLAAAFVRLEKVTARNLAEAIQDQYSSSNRTRPRPIIYASDPDLVLIGELENEAPPQANIGPRSEGTIIITRPTPTRGASAMKQAEVLIEGIVDSPDDVRRVLVNGEDATLEDDGFTFSKSTKLQAGYNGVQVVALTSRAIIKAPPLELLYEGDLQALEGEGIRYAVIIANQNYDRSTGMPDLVTPFADADAVAGILRDRFGFTTEITFQDGRNYSLDLRDPTKREIEMALHQIGKVAGAKDSVLIYYAGHGVYERPTSTAYWIPSDAERGFQPSYLSAADIGSALQRMQAGHVILISDSCYSGALMRGSGLEDADIGDERRIEFMLKLQSKRSRVVLTSGNNEPVADLGGDGHSVFARALLTGLASVEHDAFSAHELFEDFLLSEVASSSEQEPQYYNLPAIGHEGGDFVFVRSGGG